MPDKFPTDQWIEAVRWHGNTKIATIVHNEAEWADAKTLLATLENVVVEPESKQEAVVSGRRMRRWKGTCVRCGWLGQESQPKVSANTERLGQNSSGGKTVASTG